MRQRSFLLLPVLTPVLFVALGVRAQSPSIEWSHRYGGSSWEYVEDIQACPDGGYIVAGRTWSNDGDVSGNHDPDGHFPDIWLIKLDSLGALEWQHCYGDFTPELPAQVAVTEDHGYVVAGTATCNGGGDGGDVAGCHGGTDGWLFRTDSLGNLLWQRCLGGSQDDELHGLVVTPDGGIVVVGHTRSNDGDVSGLSGTAWDIWLAKVNGTGELVWQYCFDSGQGNDYGQAIVQGPSGSFTVLGHRQYGGPCPWANYKLIVFNVDSLGQTHWLNCFGGSAFEYSESLFNTMDGGYLIAGATLSNDHDGTGNHDPSGTYYDALLGRTNALGIREWAKVMGGTLHDVPMRWAELPNGDLLMLGWTGSSDGDINNTHGGEEVWLTRMNADGEPLAGWCFGGSSIDYGMGMVLEEDGGVVITGSTFSNDGDLAGLNAGPLADFWVFKLGDTDISTSSGDEAKTQNDLVLLLDQGTLEMRCGGSPCGAITLLDAQGRAIRSMRDGEPVIRLDVHDLGPGIYVVQRISGRTRSAQRVIIAP